MKKTKEQLVTERHGLVEEMKIAMAKGKRKSRKLDHLNAKYQKLSDLIKKSKE